MHLDVGHGPMLGAVRNNEEFPFADDDLAVTELHPQHALDHEKQLVLHLVRVPHELAA